MNCIEIIQADITQFKVDAIVNAANRSLLGGGGVDGAIHAVGPVWRDGDQGEVKTPASCYVSAIDLTESRGLKSIAFPAISCGASGYPLDKAAAIAIDTLAERLKTYSNLEKIVLCCFGEDVLSAFRQIFAAPLSTLPIRKNS